MKTYETKNPRSRRIRTMLRISVAMGAVLAALLAGCGAGGDHPQELQALIDAGRWDEVRARVRLWRDAGEEGAWLDRAEGLALLQSNADKAAIPLLKRAAAAEPTFGPEVAEALAARAQEDLTAGWRERAARRMVEAYRIDPTVELGELADPVADKLYRFEKDYPTAYAIYRRLALEGKGPKAKKQEWTYRYGHCSEVMGLQDQALQIYEQYRQKWPDDRQTMRYVMWRLMRLHMKWAEEAEAEGRLEDALAELQQSMIDDWHIDLQQEARFEAGRLEEERGHLEAARDWYEKILADGSRFGGEIVSKARNRLDALHRLGIH